MDINFDDLKKEFDALKNVKEESCEISCEEPEEEGGFIEIVQKYLLAPAKCGVYLSRLDIKVIGLKFGEDVQIRERRRMLRDILKAVTSKDDLKKLFDIIKESVDEKLTVYKELTENFPSSKDIFENRFEKAQNLKNRLDLILEEIKEEEI
ncbi:hypothetical protein [Nitrosophilus kaiyonis]|uniref:hypothetical protein n=1 Tax=Nitrosophilus kaiyonis TaxID=2930200 RepID=UPI002490A927|nr:hypothetical protein [Nitrosophilus kaiyonis]